MLTFDDWNDVLAECIGQFLLKPIEWDEAKVRKKEASSDEPQGCQEPILWLHACEEANWPNHMSQSSPESKSSQWNWEKNCNLQNKAQPRLWAVIVSRICSPRWTAGDCMQHTNENRISNSIQFTLQASKEWLTQTVARVAWPACPLRSWLWNRIKGKLSCKESEESTNQDSCGRLQRLATWCQWSRNAPTCQSSNQVKRETQARFKSSESEWMNRQTSELPSCWCR